MTALLAILTAVLNALATYFRGRSEDAASDAQKQDLGAAKQRESDDADYIAKERDGQAARASVRDDAVRIVSDPDNSGPADGP